MDLGGQGVEVFFSFFGLCYLATVMTRVGG